MLLERCDTEAFTCDTFQFCCCNTKPKPHLTTSHHPLTLPVFGTWDEEISGEIGFDSLRERQNQGVTFLLFLTVACMDRRGMPFRISPFPVAPVPPT